MEILHKKSLILEIPTENGILPLSLDGEFSSSNDFWETIHLFKNLSLKSHDVVICINEEGQDEDTNLVFARLMVNIEGGKGGFGAQLRSLAKQKGKKQTSDFGACRDLSGRRLRSINHEIILAKWKEAREKGEDLNVNQETPTGINLWFMAAPTWAETSQDSKHVKFLKAQYKTSFCSDWLRSRENKTSAQLRTLPKNWGCPRGPRCPFAHGEDDLKGESKELLDEKILESKRLSAQQAKDSYLKPLSDAIDSQASAIADSVGTGLSILSSSQHANKRPKSSSFIDSSINHKEMSLSSSCDGLSVVSGEVLASVSPDGLGLIGNGVFGTVAMNNFVCCDFGEYYYEAELSTDGLMQVGWCNKDHFRIEGDTTGLGDENIKSSMNNGVGDDAFSWAYDGFRQILLHNGKERICQLSSYHNANDTVDDASPSWEVGDVVGCFLSISPAPATSEAVVSMVFVLQGLTVKPVSSESFVSFSFTCPLAKCSFVPAVSLEQGESLVMNISTRPHIFQSVAKEALYLSTSKSHVSHSSDANDIAIESSAAKESNDLLSTEEIQEINWNIIQCAEDLLKYSMASLKNALMERGVKCGGTHLQRAERLYSVKDLALDQIDPKLRAFSKK